MQKNLEFEREDKSNGIPLVHHGIFFLSREFSYEHSDDFLLFFECRASISRIMDAKKTRNSIGNTQAMETHFYTTYSAVRQKKQTLR